MNKKKIIILIIIFIIIITLILIFRKTNTKYYLELIGSDITLTLGETYTEPGYKAYDSKGNNLTDKVIIENNININQIGEYTVTYQLKNEKLFRKVNIIDKEENNIDLNLVGKETIYIPKNELYEEPGITATDSNGIDISSKVTIQGNANTQIPDTYIIKYSIENKHIERKVIVYELKYQYNKSCSTTKCTISLTFNDYYYDKIIYPSGVTSKDIFINYPITENGTYKFTIYDKYGYTIQKEVIIKEIVNQQIEIPPKEESDIVIPEEPTHSTKITDNLFVGDSRTVGMCESYKLCANSKYIAEVSKNYSWFQKKAVPEINNEIKNKNYNIIILMGVNDAGGTESNGKTKATKYYETISSLATSTWNNQNIIFVSVNPVIDGYSYTYTKAVNAFNKEIKTKISSSGLSNLKYCDTNSKLNITTSNAKDGLHYNKETYKKIYDIIVNECI